VTATWLMFTLVTTVFTLVMAVIVAMPGQAGADSQQIAQIWVHGSQVSPSPVPQLAAQQAVEVKVPANSVLQAGYRANILMCSDPGAQPSNLPIDDSHCDGLTIQTGPTLNIGTGGTVDETGYVINTLPLKVEPTDAIPVCNATHACVLFVGQDQNDFQRPHVWSNAFYVGAANQLGTSGSSALLVVGIVVVVLVLAAGGFLWLRRREHGRRSTADSEIAFEGGQA